MKKIFLLLVFLFGCFGPNPPDDLGGEIMIVSSSAFSEGELIPSKYSCDGEDKSPDLTVKDIPKGTKTLALIADDPDAPGGTWTHWIVWNIPVTGTEQTIAENSVPGVQGKNDFGKLDYGGPCPPSGTHRYFFKVYALDSELDLAEGASVSELHKAMENKVLGQGTVMGKYSRQ